MQFGIFFLYFIGILVQHTDDGRRSDRNMQVIIIYVKVYFTGVHLLDNYIRVNIPLMHGYGTY